jgi:transcriptional regulator PpsR
LTDSINFAQPDITLSLDLTGVIRRAVLSNAIANEAVSGWVGQPWADTVSAGNVQVQRMVDDARATGVSAFRQVRQRFPSGLELSVEYAALRLRGDAGIVAIGRSLEAVAELRSRLMEARASMERDSWKLRDVETRYRMIFDASSEPVLLIGADDLRVIEVNPAAIRALGLAHRHAVLPGILAGQQASFNTMLARVREQGKAPGIVIHMGPGRRPWLVRASLIAADRTAIFLLQLSPAGMTPSPVERDSDALDEMVAQLPEGFVLLDGGGAIRQANRAFLDLIQQHEEGTVLGKHLDQWLTSSDASAAMLLSEPQRGRRFYEFTAILQGELGARTEVVISASGNANEVCVLVHRIASGEASSAGPAPPASGELDAAAKRRVIEASIAAIERDCLLGAVELSRGARRKALEPASDPSSTDETPPSSK